MSSEIQLLLDVANEYGQVNVTVDEIRQIRAEVLNDLWNIAISKYDEILSLEELAECIEQLKSQN